MDHFERAIGLLPQEWRQAARQYSEKSVEEIRLRVGRCPGFLIGGREQTFREETIDGNVLSRVLEKATGASLHTAAPALAEGYLSWRGIRIGVCGTAVMRDGQISGFRSLSSLAVRIPRECRGICDSVAESITREGFGNALVIAKPGGGKTTALRELIRLLSERGYRIGVADERNELAAADGGLAQFDLGRCSDVLTGAGKADAAMILLRGMNPQILAMDEITQERDTEAVRQIYGCGVGLLASAHGSDLAELRQRRGYRELLEQGIFRYLVRIEGTGSRRRYLVERIRV